MKKSLKLQILLLTAISFFLDMKNEFLEYTKDYFAYIILHVFDKET